MARHLTRWGTALTDLLARLRGFPDYRSYPGALNPAAGVPADRGGSYPAPPLPPGLRSVSSRKNRPVTHWLAAVPGSAQVADEPVDLFPGCQAAGGGHEGAAAWPALAAGRPGPAVAALVDGDRPVAV